ncbi:MAG: glycosyltransferase family 4 protein [Clostridia bacterium]|nr:glycosyltransferase family 4 protein [Clostridia bacterium]
MRILVLANFDLGLYNFRKELLQKLMYMGNEIYISCPYGEKIAFFEEMGCKFIKTDIERRRINPISDLKLITKYFKILNKVKPDKVITYTIKPNIYGGIVCRIKRVPIYVNITGLGTAFNGSKSLEKIAEIMYRNAFRRAKVVFFENEGNRDFLVNKGLVQKDITHCLNGAGVNIREYSLREYPKDGTIHFLFVGRVMREKGVDELFAVAKRFYEEGENAVIDVVGPFEDNYTDIVGELDKHGAIKYHGYQNDVKTFIDNAHCIVLPSWHEGMSNTLLEGGACGRALITSGIHGCMEAVKDGETGYLVKVKDAGDLYKKMKQFLALPYDEKCKMSLLSHEFVTEKFNRDKVVSETVEEIMG